MFWIWKHVSVLRSVVSHFLPLLHRQPGFVPGSPSAVERDRIWVAHLAQRFGYQRGAVPSAAIQHHRGGLVWRLGLDIALDDPLAQVNSSRRVARRPFVVLAYVDQQVPVARHFAVLVDV